MDLKAIKKLFTGFCPTCNKEVSLISKEELTEKKGRIKSKSAKQKGRRGQQKVAEMLVAAFELAPEDFESIVMGQSGQDIRLTENARKRWPFHAIEITTSLNQSVWAKFSQAQEHAAKQLAGKVPGNGRAILIFKKNNTPLFAMITLEDLLAAIRERTRFPKI
jgi:hypothetical protein